jgi:uncharacterized protein YbjT (DUF2867 family)
VEHHITLSIVGINRLQGGGYFRAKMVQEKLIQESPVPYTILRSTQFFEFMGGIADAGTVGDTVLVSPALFQPVASDDVAASLVDITLSRPVNGIVEVAGPERVHLAELVKRFLSETGDTRKVVADVNARYFGAVLNDSTLIPGENPRLGSQTFEAWLSQSRVKA